MITKADETTCCRETRRMIPPSLRKARSHPARIARLNMMLPKTFPAAISGSLTRPAALVLEINSGRLVMNPTRVTPTHERDSR